MAKKNMISVNMFDEAAEFANEDVIVEWNGLDIAVNRRIGYEDMSALITAVSGACFAEDGTYHPEAQEFALRLAVFRLYTNLTVPSNIDKRYNMAFSSDLYDRIEEAIMPAQIHMIRSSVDRKVSQRAHAAVDAVIRQANSVAEAVQNLSEKLEAQFSDLLGDVTPEELNRVIHGIAEGQVDEEKVVDAYKKTRRVSVSTLPAGVLEDN